MHTASLLCALQKHAAANSRIRPRSSSTGRVRCCDEPPGVVLQARAWEVLAQQRDQALLSATPIQIGRAAKETRGGRDTRAAVKEKRCRLAHSEVQQRGGDARYCKGDGVRGICEEA